MNERLGILADEVARALGDGASVSVPEDVRSRQSDGDIPAEHVFRLVRIAEGTGERTVLVADLPHGWPNPERASRTAGDDIRHIDDAMRTLNHMASGFMGRRDLSHPAFILVTLGKGWDEQLMSRMVELDSRFCEKFVMREGETPAQALDRVPSLGRNWAITEPADPVWITAARAEALGCLRKVEMDLGSGPGLTVLHGGNNTGKTYTLSCLLSGFQGGSSDSGLVVEGTGLPRRAPGQPSEQGMERFRRLMSYGDEDGKLFMPIEFDSNAFQQLERMGRSLTACAEAPGSWPGLALDVPARGLDEIRHFRIVHAVAALARERQVIVTCRGGSELGLWETAAACAGARFAGTSLNGGELVLSHRVPEAAPAPETVPAR